MRTASPSPDPAGVTSTWRATAVVGLVLLAFAGWIGTVFPQDNLGYAPGYGPPVLAFEFARTPEDLLAVFGPKGTARQDLIFAMDAGNRLDFAFMLIYGSFVFLFHRAATSLGGPAIAAWLGPLAALCDAIENMLLLGITADLAAAPGLAWLRIPVTLKFGALAASAWFAGHTLFRTDHAGWKVAGGVVMLGALVSAGSLLVPHLAGQGVVLGIGLGWLVMWAASGYQLRRS